MNSKRVIAVWCMLVCMACSIFAQENPQAKNPIKKVVFNNLIYQKPEAKKGVASVLGVISDLVSGQTTQQETSYVEAVRASTIKGISQSRRFTIMDGGNTEGADYYVDGTISNISTTTKTEDQTDKDGKKHTYTTYKANIGVTLHLKSSQTNTIVASPSFNISDYDVSWVETANGAINNALARLAYRVHDYFDCLLPLRANIIEGATDKKDKQKEVYIDLGSATKGVYADIHFGVYVVRTIAGKEAKRQIGKLRLKTVMGDDISLCKVQSGGKDIKAALDAGENILIESTD